MVKNIVLGLLAMGAIPLILADATATSEINEHPSSKADNKNNNSNNLNLDRSCSSLEFTSHCLTSENRDKSNSKLYSELWLGDIADFLLSGSLLQRCQKIAQPSMAKLSKPGCIFSRQYSAAKLRYSNQNPGNNLQRESLNKNLENQNNSLTSSFNDVNTAREFPTLSRSSLIVSLPPSDTTFTPKNPKLANPAPEAKRIASPFGWRRRPFSYQHQFHQGVDYGAPLGSPVVAVGNGIVTKVVSGCYDFGNLFCGGQLGNWIEIDHGNGMLGVYGHLKNNSIAIKEGTKVWKNQEIAQVGSSGWSTGAHLDFRLKVNGKYEDPATHLTPPDLPN